MKIIVCIKQIPDTNDVKWNKDNNIIRDNTISVMNPYDLSALGFALEIKNKIPDTTITLLSMGPIHAVQSVRYGLSLGADAGILLSDKKFSGADTNATSKTLSCAIKNVLKDYDLILTGQFALDGDTAQTPYSLANRLGLEILGYTNEIIDVNENEITVCQLKDNGIYKTKSTYPVLVSISKTNVKINPPKINDYIKGQDKEIKILNAEDILINPDEAGIKGSPTYVSKAFRPENKRVCKFINSIEELSGEIFNA